MQPSQMADTSSSLFPNLRFCISMLLRVRSMGSACPIHPLFLTLPGSSKNGQTRTLPGRLFCGLGAQRESRAFRSRLHGVWMDGTALHTTVISVFSTAARILEPPGGVAAWPDARLVAAVRRDPPDEAALEALAHRYWQQ